VRQFVGNNVVNAVGRSPRQLRVEENDARLFCNYPIGPSFAECGQKVDRFLCGLHQDRVFQVGRI